MKISDKVHIKSYTTLGIGGIVQQEFCLEEKKDVEALALHLQEIKLPFILLGGGSNVLIDDSELDCVLIKDVIDSKKPIEVVSEEKDTVLLKVSSGYFLPSFIKYCEKQGFSGLEGLAGVPGRMGGALAMNAGAFSCQMEDVFEKADIFSPEFGIKSYAKNDCNFAYRHFSLKQQAEYKIHLDMELRLKKSTPEQVSAKIKENFQKKKASQPLAEKTAGCAFKNPRGTAAGKLIEEVGLKGYRLNDMSFSSLHANFLVNHKNATFENAIELIELAKQKVFTAFNIVLETEIKILSQKTGF